MMQDELDEDELDAWGEEPEYISLKSEDYYDLIELPNGKHIPVPIARRLFGEKIVDSIPMGRKLRDDKFFYCAQCDANQQRIDAWLKDHGGGPPALPNGHSFYRCKIHKPSTKVETDAKEAMMLRLILGGLYRSMKYIRANRT